MSKIAFIYPGQGAQAVGMGADFYEKSPLSKAVFDQASEVVSLDLKKLCFEENDLLNKTEYTQVAMVTACLAMTRAVETMGLHADMTAGLTVRARGIFMEHAAPEGTGAMSAVLGLDAGVIEDVLRDREGVSIANYNCPGQIVITGEAKAVAEAGNALKETGARRVLPLKVSGPFHSPMMQPAGEELAKVFAGVGMNPLKLPYVANINAEVVTDCGKIEGLLVAQVSGSVRWQQSVETMIREGADTFVEIGPGKTLTGFLRKIDRNVKAYHIGSWEEAVSVCEELKQK